MESGLQKKEEKIVKRICIFILTVGLCLTSLYLSAYAESDAVRRVMPGDVNGDLHIFADDARLVLASAAKLEEIAPAFKANAEVTEDGRIDAKDARKILRVAAKLERFEKHVSVNAGGKIVIADLWPGTLGSVFDTRKWEYLTDTDDEALLITETEDVVPVEDGKYPVPKNSWDQNSSVRHINRQTFTVSALQGGEYKIQFVYKIYGVTPAQTCVIDYYITVR